VAQRVSRYGDTVYTLRHPGGLSHVELDATDFEVLGWMDGSASLIDLASRYFEVHGQLAIYRIRRLAATLYAAGLVTDGQTPPGDRQSSAEGMDLVSVVEAISCRFRWATHGLGLLAVVTVSLAGLVVLAAQLASGHGPSLVLGGSLTLGTVVAIALIAVIAVVHEVGHAIAVKAANRHIGRAGIDVRRIGLYMDTSDVLMASRASRVGVAVAGPLTGMACGGVATLAAAYISPALLLVGYLSYALNLMNLLPLGQLDGRRALVWFLEARDPLRQAWRELQSGSRLAFEAAAACLAAALVALSVLLLFGWALVTGAQWISSSVATLSAVDEVLPSLIGVLLLVTLASRPVLLLLITRERKRRFQAAAWERAQALLDGMPMFLNLDSGAREQLLGRAHFEQVSGGKTVVRQGARGNRFYILLDGSASVRQWRPAGGDQLVARLGAGDFFGELALLRGARRAASVVATSDLALLSIDRSTFHQVIAPQLRSRQATDQLLRGRSVLAGTPLFQQLSPFEIDWVLSRFVPEHVGSGETIIRQGESGDRFYLIVAGACRVWREPSVAVARLGAGEYFGEIALLRDIPRTATVTAESDVDLLTLSRDDFRELFSEQPGNARPLGEVQQACYRIATQRLAELVY